MNVITLVLILLFSLGVTPRLLADGADGDKGVALLAYSTQCEEVSGKWYSGTQYLCAYRTPLFFADWFLLSDLGIQPIGGIGIAGNLYGFKLSANKDSLVLVYGEEGHPTLVYYDISNWDSEHEPGIIWSASTYPGSIGYDDWRGDELIVESDHDLLAPGQPYREAQRDGFMRFGIDRTGKIRRLSN